MRLALKHIWFSLWLVFFSQFSAHATHIVGGDIYYDHVGGNNYKFYISLYRDCNTILGAPYDSPLPLGVFTSNNQLFLDLDVTYPGSVTLPIIFNNPCVQAPTGICTERAIYTVTLNLPPRVGGYKVVYQRCCRQPSILNLADATNEGITLVATIPGSETGATVNSSPRFSNYPPLAICNNDELNFDHSATDPDGDNLVYSLITPLGSDPFGPPNPNPIPNPPYQTVVWEAGFGAANPLGPGSSISINPTTGQLLASPNLLGLYVVGIRVDEYRNGTYIGGNTRDFLFTVVNCVISLQAILPLQPDLATFQGYCNGLTVDFENNSYGASNYSWDFGVPGITTDVSTQTAPSYTYPAPGTYFATLVANPGWPCTDTAIIEILVDNAFKVDFTATDSVCFEGHSIDFVGSSSVSITPGQTTTYAWDFGPNASQSSSTNSTVNGITYPLAGTYPVTLTGVRNQCTDSTTLNVVIFEPPIADFTMPTEYECDGQSITFTSTSTGSINYNWDFGDPSTTADVSTLANPTYSYAAPGIYTIQLISGSNGTCFDTVAYTYEIYQDVLLAMAHPDSMCITNNSFDFIGTVSGPAGITTYTWDLGQNASPSTVAGTDALGVSFATPGNHTVTLTGSYLNCMESITSNVFLFKEPTIDFSIVPASQCAPFIAQFIDMSSSDTPLQYAWNFGDGGTSTAQNPSYVFNTPGVYPITLDISSNEGCIANLSLTKSDLVDVKPKPESIFTTSTDQVDICNSEVIFLDQSTGGSIISYILDDNNAFANNVPTNFSYNYQTAGYKNVVQIIQNIYGCEDRSTNQLYIEPFTVYLPNAFTPDGDQFNNEWSPVVALNASEWHLIIYNRWGEKLWESFDQNAGWDGFYKGRKMQQGVYGYTVRYVGCGLEDKYKTLSGHFSLLQ